MSWIDKKNIGRIFRTFKRLKNQIFNEDIEALKELNESLENVSKSHVNDNLLYAKLLAVVLRQNMEFYGSMKFAIKDTNSILAQSLENHIMHLTKSLNREAELGYLKSLGFKLDNVTKDTDMNLLNDNQKEIVIQLKKSWTYENVSKSFFNSANDFLKDINNYK